jgi:hypothetical protein
MAPHPWDMMDIPHIPNPNRGSTPLPDHKGGYPPKITKLRPTIPPFPVELTSEGYRFRPGRKGGVATPHFDRVAPSPPSLLLRGTPLPPTPLST